MLDVEWMLGLSWDTDATPHTQSVPFSLKLTAAKPPPDPSDICREVFGSNPERACAADLFEMIVVTHEWVIDQ